MVLSVAGLISLRQVRTSSQIPFASIPFVFAVQQFTEGLLWIALRSGTEASLQGATTHLYLVFAQVVWPVWVPFSILLVEENRRRKPALRIFVAIGVLVSVCLAYCLFRYPVRASILEYHIHYRLDYPQILLQYGSAFYMIATVVPPFFSSRKRMWFLGLAILVSYIITRFFYEVNIISVWCFFAAVIAISVVAILRDAGSGNAEEG